MELDPDSFFHEVCFVLDDRQKFPKSKKHNVLPITFTLFLARRIRQNACRQSGTRDCHIWQDGQRAVPISNYRCIECNSPGISRDDFSRSCWGSNSGGIEKESNRPLVGPREMRRMLNENGPMRPDRLRALLVNAHAQHWTPGWNVSALLESSIRLEATVIGLRRLEAKIGRSAEYKKTERMSFDSDQLNADIAIEVGKIHRQLFKKAVKRTDILLQLQEEQEKCVTDLQQTALMCEQMGSPDSAALIREFIERAPPLPQNCHTAVDKHG